MDLVGQGSSDCDAPKRSGSGLDASGFTMVVLLVVMAVMAVGTAALLPTWRQQTIREQEEELVFRGNQYARAVLLYSRKNNNLLPSDIEVLYTGKFLRKKYKDPITGGDFGLLPAGQPAGAAGRGSLGQNAGRGGTTPATGRGGFGAASSSGRGSQVIGSIQGVYSTSTATSIRVYQNQQRYIDWPFTFQTAQLLMGQARGAGASNGLNGIGGNPGRNGGPTPGSGPGSEPRPGSGVGRGGGRAGAPPPGSTGGRSGVPPGTVGGRGRGTLEAPAHSAEVRNNRTVES